MTSAFVIQVDSQLRPDPGNETAALLRVLIYKIDSTTFGDNVPTLPQWTGPPAEMVHVQSFLFASLTVSLFSTFLAMLGRQWLSRYASTLVRGSAVERSQNRQRKLDGIIAWYFNHVIESIPTMLQIGLFLLGCALSLYLWDINTAVASVVVGVTSFGVVFYLFIVIVGAAFENCPYQVLGSHVLRYLGPKIWRTIHSARSAVGSVLRNILGESGVIRTIVLSANSHDPWWSRREVIPFLRALTLKLPRALAIDIYRLGKATIRALSALPIRAYHLAHRANGRLYGIYATSKQILGQQTAPQDFRCISWTLQTSLDKSVHLTASEHLTTMMELTGLDPTLVVDCFNVFVGCVSINNHTLVVMKGLDRLATVSAGCFFRIVRHIWVTDPTSSVLADLRRRYERVFPFRTDFRGLPFYHIMTMTHALVHNLWGLRNLRWDDYRPSGQEHISLARHIVEVAQVEYQRMQRRKIPRWILRFALHSLSLDSLPPSSVIADCLTTIAIDLGCDLSNVTIPDDRCVQI